MPHDDLEALDDDLIDEIFRVSWRVAFATIRALKTLLTTGDGGVVVNISSISGLTGIDSNVSYCASKAAMNAMTSVLGRALVMAFGLYQFLRAVYWVNMRSASILPI